MPYSLDLPVRIDEDDSEDYDDFMTDMVEMVRVAKYSHDILMGIIEAIPHEEGVKREFLVKIAFKIFDAKKGHSRSDMMAYDRLCQVI